MVRSLQPDILINNRSGAPEDFGTPEGHVSAPGDCSLWEACLTMAMDSNSGWGYWRDNTYRKTAAQLVYLLVQAAANGGNTLFNVSPDPDGVIPGWQVELLHELGGWMRGNSEAIYGVRRSDAARDINGTQGNSCGIVSEKGSNLYFYMLEWPGQETVIPIMRREIKRAVLLKTGQELRTMVDNRGRLHISGLPLNQVDPYCSVIRLETA